MKYKIGITGNSDVSYLGFGVAAIQSLDSSRFMVDFVTMSEEEAKEAFRKGEVIAYIIIPDEFLHAIVYGYNDVPLLYVTTHGTKGLESYLMDELVNVVSKMVLSSQCSIYSMQTVAMELGMTEEFNAWTGDYNLRLIGYVLGRSGLWELEELGISNGLLITQYYFCSVLLLFCFLFGISCAPLFLRRNEDLGKWMKMRGIGAAAQVLCEYATYFFFMMLCLIVPLGILNSFMPHFTFLNVRIWLDELIWALLPVVFMASAMHFMIYETVKNPVANLLLQFLGVLGMSYVSGYIYPASFFPERMAKLGRILPTGTAFEYLTGKLFRFAIVENEHVFLWVMGFGIVFLGISIFSRRWSIVRENG